MSQPDYLQVFTGVPSSQLLGWLRTVLDQREGVEARALELLTDNPLEANVGFLFSAAAAFYLAERHVNPKVNTFVDALYYISTCLSVGYADIFAQTQSGKAIATLVMTVGPALTAELLDPRHHAAGASAVGQERVIARLDAILDELRTSHPATPTEA